MTQFVMIHGGAHGSWCWQPLLGLFRAPMLAIDLPGRGYRPARLEDQSYASFAEAAEEDIRRADLTDVVLVAHSMGGITAIQLMERIPERIRHVVFCASPVPPSGSSIGAYMQQELLRSSERNEAQKALEDGSANNGIADMLFHDLSDADRAWCLARVGAESMAVFNEPVRLVGLASDIPRSYIKTLRDRGLPPSVQDDSITRLGNARVETMDTGHTAMIANPAEFARIVADVAG